MSDELKTAEQVAAWLLRRCESEVVFEVVDDEILMLIVERDRLIAERDTAFRKFGAEVAGAELLRGFLASAEKDAKDAMVEIEHLAAKCDKLTADLVAALLDE